MKREEVTALFVLAGFDVIEPAMLPNEYWPKGYFELINRNPWWNVHTEYGVIKIGWRKKVIEMTWPEGFAVTATKDENVTCFSDYVHAWSYAKAVEYLTAARIQIKSELARRARE